MINVVNGKPYKIYKGKISFNTSGTGSITT